MIPEALRAGALSTPAHHASSKGLLREVADVGLARRLETLPGRDPTSSTGVDLPVGTHWLGRTTRVA